ncbi:MAG: hypothetical protein KIT69_14295, partial [Propionibacteriaceae bacterium]|nr:hypothetical protein [Propionibacteriaceae bacterium]
LNKIMREKLYNYRYLNSDTKFICKNNKQEPFKADYYYKDIFGNWNLLSEDSKMTHSGRFAYQINFNLFDNIPIGQMTKTLQKNYNFV